MKLKREANSFQKTNSDTPTKAQAPNVAVSNKLAVTSNARRERGPSGQRAATRAKSGNHQHAAARS